METKKCSSCGNELPISQFHKNAATKDGLQPYCKACIKAKRDKIMHGSNNALRDFSPRELIAELRARGYEGELRIVQKITV